LVKSSTSRATTVKTAAKMNRSKRDSRAIPPTSKASRLNGA
jgi:hypothetical protein